MSKNKRKDYNDDSKDHRKNRKAFTDNDFERVKQRIKGKTVKEIEAECIDIEDWRD